MSHDDYTDIVREANIREREEQVKNIVAKLKEPLSTEEVGLLGRIFKGKHYPQELSYLEYALANSPPPPQVLPKRKRWIFF